MTMDKDLYWTQAGFTFILLAFVYTDWLVTATGESMRSYNTVFVILLSAGVVFLLIPLLQNLWKNSVRPKMTRGDGVNNSNETKRGDELLNEQ